MNDHDGENIAWLYKRKYPGLLMTSYYEKKAGAFAANRLERET